MLRVSLRKLCDSKRAARFVSPTSFDHGVPGEAEVTEDRVSVLLEELTRERLLVKSLREENEALRGNVTLVSQREAELSDLESKLKESAESINSYSRRLSDQEIRFNNLRVDFEDYKKLVEIEKLKLNQARALPLILSGVAGAVVAYLVVRADMQLEKENAKYLKFELDQIWQARVREVQSSLDQVRDERDELSKKLGEKKPTGWLEIAGRRVF
jgi:hypothetical protein